MTGLPNDNVPPVPRKTPSCPVTRWSDHTCWPPWAGSTIATDFGPGKGAEFRMWVKANYAATRA